ncbi:expressed conserved protein [Echinococcus multilocularis]|uniref:Expressed conserved protein n=1 Tax=Echinococcus multilocularis TaxID=6211 RepID=A0A068Y7X7_ECHMU|nr:expressed conserved protein [Echinococcus multilocularis]
MTTVEISLLVLAVCVCSVCNAAPPAIATAETDQGAEVVSPMEVITTTAEPIRDRMWTKCSDICNEDGCQRFCKNVVLRVRLRRRKNQ